MPSSFDLLGARRVLAVQPHYDDNDIAAAGTFALLAARGARVTYVTVTDDLAGVLDTDLDDDTATRELRAEQHAAGAILGVAAQHWLEWPDARGLDQIALRDQIVAVIRAERPDVVVTCDPWLPREAHSDHVRTGLAVCEAALLAGLPRFLRDSGAPHTVARVALYFSAQPDTFVDTSTVQAERHAALDCYRLQFTDDDRAGLHAVLDRFESSHARARVSGDATHAEGFNVVPAGSLHVGVTLTR